MHIQYEWAHNIACGYCSADYSDGVRQILIPIEWVQGKKVAVLYSKICNFDEHFAQV